MRRIKKATILLFLIIGVSISVAYKSDFFEIAKQLEIYTTLFKELNMYYIDDINPAKINEVGINSMLKSLDPYTRFYDEQGVENARINANGQYGGTGLVAKFKNNKLIVTDIIEASPAAKKALFIGDEIIAINGIAVDVKQKKTSLFQLRGLPDAKIILKIKRQNKSFEKELSLVSIIKNPVPYYSLFENKTGYIALTKFNEKSFDKVEEALLSLKEQGMTHLVLDLRYNPGGLLNQAIAIVSLFVPKGSLVVTTKAKVEKWSNTYRTKKEALDLTIPIVVLVNGRSASASEIVSGALQDLDRAVIVGTRSYGKGLVQRYRKLTYGTQFKLTISKYYTPSGRNIQEMDYTNRVGDSIPKFSDQERPKFNTKNGRIIYGGGGITPDLIVAAPTTTKTTKSLLKTDAVFNFATQYYYKHPQIKAVEDFSLNASDFQDFVTYVKTDEVFVSPVQKSINTSYKLALKANLGVGKTYQNLKDQVDKEQFTHFQKDNNVIKEALSSEIIRRYYFKKGMYQYNLSRDNTLKKAINLLNDNTKYQSILH